MKHLVTGATGFSGTRLVSLLRDQSGSEVLGISRGGAADRRIACDLLDGRAVRAVLEGWKPSRIYHLVGAFSNEWHEDFEANVETTRVLLDAVCALALPCRILLVGSAAEYGRMPAAPVHEDTALTPMSVYGLTKVLQTELMGFYHRRYNLHVVMARTFNLFGEGCPTALFPGHVQQQIARVQSGLQTQIRVRDLSSERDYLPVTDAVRAYRRILEHGEAGQVYNVGSGVPVRMSEFLSRLLQPHGLSLRDVQIQSGPPGSQPDMAQGVADLRKLAALPD